MNKNYIENLIVNDGGNVNFGSVNINKNIQLVIDGNDISYLVKIINHCLVLGYHPKVDIFGYSNILKKNVHTQLYTPKSEIDLYVRGILGTTSDKENITVGGANASKQNIAAKKFTIYLPNDIYGELTNKYPWISIYNVSIDNANIYSFLKNYPITENSINDFVSLLKKYPEENIINKLLNLLSSKLIYSDEVFSTIVESFRILNDVCLTNPKLEIKIIYVLEKFLYKAFIHKYYKSTIYAVEAIGAIQNTEKTNIIINNITSFIIKNIDIWDNSKYREHLIWCSLSMLKTSKQIICTDYKHFVFDEKFEFIPSQLIQFHLKE